MLNNQKCIFLAHSPVWFCAKNRLMIQTRCIPLKNPNLKSLKAKLPISSEALSSSSLEMLASNFESPFFRQNSLSNVHLFTDAPPTYQTLFAQSVLRIIDFNSEGTDANADERGMSFFGYLLTYLIFSGKSNLLGESIMSSV